MDKETRGRFLAIEAEERREALTTQPNVSRTIAELKEEIWRARIEVEVARSQAREIGRRIDDMELQLSSLTGAGRVTPVVQERRYNVEGITCQPWDPLPKSRMDWTREDTFV